MDDPRNTWNLSKKNWLGFLSLEITPWYFITHIGLLMEVIWGFFASSILTFAFYPVAEGLKQWHILKPVYVIAGYLIIGRIIFLIGFLLNPALNAEIERIKTRGPALIQQALTQVSTIPNLKSLLPGASSISQNLFQRLDSLVEPVKAMWVFLFYFVIARIKSHLIAPFVYSRAVGLRQVIIFISLFIGVKLADTAFRSFCSFDIRIFVGIA